MKVCCEAFVLLVGNTLVMACGIDNQKNMFVLDEELVTQSYPRNARTTYLLEAP